MREAIDTQIITINDIKSKDNVADFGTKSLEPTCHANQMPKALQGLETHQVRTI